MKPEDAEEYTQALGQVVAGGYRQVALGERLGVPSALGLTTPQWVEQRLGGYVRMSIPERREAVAELAAEGLTQREIADVLGVSQKTVDRDMEPESNDSGTIDPVEERHVGTRSDVEPESNDSGGLPAGQERADAILAGIDEAAAAEQLPQPVDFPVETHAAPEPLQPVEPGWHQIGEHLLYCGDSADQEFIDACQGAAFAFADPPYNAGKAAWDEGFEWQHDYLAEAAAIVAVTPGIASLAGFLANSKMPYRWSMAAEITNGMTAGALRFGNWICVTLFAHGSIYRKAKDHVRLPAATGDDHGGGHASRKPIRLLTHLIELFTTKGDTVVDPFLGSGTTLIADLEYAIDCQVAVTVDGLRAPIRFAVQERWREPEAMRWGDITITEWNQASNEPSELHKLGAQLFVYGFYDKATDHVVLAVAIDVAKVLYALALGKLAYRRQSRLDQSFLGFSFQDIGAAGAVIFDIDYRPQANPAPAGRHRAQALPDCEWPTITQPGSGRLPDEYPGAA